MKSTQKRVDLDWSKLFGFNQVKSAKNTPEARAIIGGKIGAKVGGKGLPPVEANT
ncbi:MAG TPA: hypothetical protein VEH04_15320 [Verrucomicrobiae bacterium]|nr:hypothetical protein [Verrucomicrobiae bacterium]